MSRKAPTKEQLRERLRAPHFGKVVPLEPSDPISKTAMIVDVFDIETYEYNPRTVPNRKFVEIKESLRTNGLERPLPITIRQGDEQEIHALFRQQHRPASSPRVVPRVAGDGGAIRARRGAFLSLGL